eukprot:5964971-Amphidinium_carterae.1
MPNPGAQGGPTTRIHDYSVGVCVTAVHSVHTGYAVEQALGRAWANPCRGPEAVGTPRRTSARIGQAEPGSVAA